MSSRYTEIYILKEMLEKAEIPHEFFSRSFCGFESYQIVYPNDENRKISVIQGKGTYGAGHNLLEIMGLLTEEELKQNPGVAGGLSAKNIFDRITADYELNNKVEILPETAFSD